MIGHEVDQAYNEKLMTISENPTLADEVDVKVVFTPFMVLEIFLFVMA